MENKAVIEVCGLTKKYKNVLALDGLSFSVKRGEVFGLLGPNGAGKSSAVKIMTTLAQPDGGTVTLFGVDVVKEPTEVRKMVGYVAQQSAVDGDFSAIENLMLQGRLYGLKGSQLKMRVSEMIDRFELSQFANRLSRTYSGGMKRKLDLAMGLIHRPKILFLDEPTTGLDPEARASLWKTIQQLAREDGLTVLLTTHYLEEADQLSDQLAIMEQGKVIVEGTAESLKGQLEGDTLQVEMKEGGAEDAVKVLEKIECIQEVLGEGASLYLRCANGSEAMPIVMSTLEKTGIYVNSATISRPSLDDVYLRYTGRTFHDAQKKEVLIT
ncbi:ATP-binding cassette domain-containing protein [Evansella halocellulosilytica]|uniref:ATP-binding cassette domain-containing protein n=1 Tax=Evansella halocellulosilytica TaxID=2011013 RepID=UPI000BB70A58|nr:ATP-binding cassette domain-containing protein [Evansella halocellulosilytica]